MNNRRNLIAGLSVAVLAVVALLGYLIWSGYREAIQAAETTTRDYAAILEARLDATLRRVDADLQELSRTIPVAALSQQAVPRYNSALMAQLNSRLSGFPEMADFVVTDATGERIYTTAGVGMARLNIAGFSYFGTLRDNPQAGLVISEVLTSRSRQQPIVVVARALRDAQGVFRGIVFGTIKLDGFEKLFQSLDVGAHGTISWRRTDDQRLVLRWPHLAEAVNKPLLNPNNPIMQLRPGQRMTTHPGSAEVDGFARIYSSQALEHYPFYIGVGISRDDALAAWRMRSLAVGLSGLVVLGLLIGLLYRLQRAEATLQANEKLMRSTFEQAAVGIAHISAATYRILMVNDKYCALLGYARDELVGADSRLLTPSEELSTREAERAQVLSGEAMTSTCERCMVRKDGGLLWVNRSLSLVRDEAGQPQYFISIIEDITIRKQREADLRRFRAAMDATEDAIYITDRATLRVIDVNDGACTALGLTRDQIFALGPSGVLSISNEELARIYDAVIASGGAYPPTEMLRSRKGGKQAWIEVRRHAHRTDEGWMIVTVARDITERKQAEAQRVALEGQLRELQKMEAIGTLAGGIAHEINNIIAAILGNAELAFQDVSTNPGAAQQSVDEIRKAGRRARDVVRQILSFSRRQPTERKLTALAPIVDESVRLLRATLPARVVLDVRCDADLPLVLVDATQIQQIIINLVNNAMQAMRGKPGRIEIRLDTVLLDAALLDQHPKLRAMHDRHPGRTVRLAVSDDGLGMDTATLARIFEPFFTTKSAGEGTGLGLPVVYGIVQTHEGAIEVDSQPGNGSTFTVYLPPAEPQTGKAVADDHGVTATALSLAGGQHMLYLDDDESLVFLVKRLLERYGYRVSGYTDQREALAVLRRDPAAFDLVVTDYNMPGMSGLDVAREVRMIRADLPVAIASGFIDDALNAQAHSAGVRELIFKADEVETLCASFARLAQKVGAALKSS